MHNIQDYIKGLKQLLVSDKKKIAFLFGAGTSCPHIPAVEKMTVSIVKEITTKTEGEIKEKYKKAINEIKIELTESKYNIETLLSNLEQKHQIIGEGSLNGLKKCEVFSLIKAVKEEIKEKVNIDRPSDFVHIDLAEWIGKANRKYPIEIFTTNYDHLFEFAMEEKNIPYYDGFTGSFKPFFHAESIEDLGFIPTQTKLWKMHGSLNWHYDEQTKKIYRQVFEGEDILIYPSHLKYMESKKQPYIALMDRLTNFLKQPDTLLITCGYSFGDEHINERIITALKSGDSGHVMALYYDELDENNSTLIKLAQENNKLSVYGYTHAIIGGQYGEWEFKQDDKQDDNLEDIKQFWDWENKKFILPKFCKFICFLKNMILEDNSLNNTNE